jgi:hypothetical protein
MHEKLTKYVFIIYQSLNTKQFAVLLFDVKTGLTSENLQEFESQ